MPSDPAEPSLNLNLLAKITCKVIIKLEKRTPHCKLSVVKALVEAGKVPREVDRKRRSLFEADRDGKCPDRFF